MAAESVAVGRMAELRLLVESRCTYCFDCFFVLGTASASPRWREVCSNTCAGHVVGMTAGACYRDRLHRLQLCNRLLAQNTWAQDSVSDAGLLVLQSRHAAIVCHIARSSSAAHEGSMANQIHGSSIYIDVALLMRAR